MNNKPDRPQPAKLAPHHQRLFALLIDYLAASSLIKLAEQLLLGEHWDLRLSASSGDFSPYWVGGLILLMLCKDLMGGRSPGKWIMGIAAVSGADPSQPPATSALLLRNVTLPLLPVEGVMVFFDPHCRRLGDKFAGTVVVASRNIPSYSRRWLAIAILFLAMLLASFLISPWNLRRSAAYQEALSHLAGHPALVEAVGSPFELDNAPGFELSVQSDVSTAAVTFTAEGPAGRAQAQVQMSLDTGANRWRVDEVKVEPELEEEEEKPIPEPTVKDAPRLKEQPPPGQ